MNDISINIQDRINSIKENIIKSFIDSDELIKGFYVDNSLNRKEGRVGKKYGEDKSGNYIGDGKHHVEYNVKDLTKKYPQISQKVDKSETTESVYVTYVNNDNDKKVTLRFSNHENNAVKTGEQLNGYITSEDEILYKLDLKKRVFVPETRLIFPFSQVSKKKINQYKESPLTIREIYSLGENADISKYKGMIAKDSNYLIEGDTIKKVEMHTLNSKGEKVRIGSYKYVDK